MDEDAFEFILDLDNDIIVFKDGFCTAITQLLDHNGREVDDKEDAAFVVAKMPPDGLHMAIDLSVLPDECLIRTNH
jgi:hypothetical protein